MENRASSATSYRSLAAAVTVICLSATAATAQIGDCDRDGRVNINELVLAVNISLGQASLASCRNADRDGDGRVSIDELVAAVRAAIGDPKTQTHAFVVTTNFQAGSFATVAIDEPREVTPSSSQRRVHSDAVARVHDGRVYVLNRLFADNVQLLDPDDDFRTVFQCSTGNGTNPRDIAFAGDDKAYVTLFEEAELLIVNPAPRSDCSDFEIGRIDLGSFADADGIPDMDQMAIVDGLLYVALQRLDINTVLRDPAGPGMLAVIDTATDRLVDSIELSGENPFAATKGLTVRGDELYVSLAGQFEEIDGGIERIDLSSGESDGFIITEAELGGDITDFLLVNENNGYAVVSRPGFRNALVQFFPQSQREPVTRYEVGGFDLFDIELNDRGEIYLADRTNRADGIRIFDARAGEAIVDQAIDLGLAPFEIVFIP